LPFEIEPATYEKKWQKFEDEVYQLVKSYLGDKFVVLWNPPYPRAVPDVVVYAVCGRGECNGCEEKLKPILLFDAFCKYNIASKDFNELLNRKIQQFKKYKRVIGCQYMFIVMPKGYAGRPVCKIKDLENVFIISFRALEVLLKFVKDYAKITYEEDVCGDVVHVQLDSSIQGFILEFKSKAEQCPVCESSVYLTTLIYCSYYRKYMYYDSLDYDIVKKYVLAPTYVECDGCESPDALLGMGDYDSCTWSKVVFMFQCSKCGAIFDPDTRRILKVSDFVEAHQADIEMFPYYSRIRKTHKF